MELIFTAMAGAAIGFVVTCLMVAASNGCEDCPYKINYIESITESQEEI